MKRDCLIGMVLVIGLTVSTAAFAASVGGLVANSQGQPVSGVTIVAKDTTGKVLGQGTTGSSGVYDIKGLNEGNYNFTLEPGSTGFQGQTVASYVGPDGVCLNWGVSTTSPAVASAQPGATCQIAAAGWDTAEMVGAGAAVLGGTGIGLAVGLGSGGDNGHRTPSSTGQ